jgi:hypothetical protein
MVATITLPRNRPASVPMVPTRDGPPSSPLTRSRASPMARRAGRGRPAAVQLEPVDPGKGAQLVTASQQLIQMLGAAGGERHIPLRHAPARACARVPTAATCSSRSHSHRPGSRLPGWAAARTCRIRRVRSGTIQPVSAAVDSTGWTGTPARQRAPDQPHRTGPRAGHHALSVTSEGQG